MITKSTHPPVKLIPSFNSNLTQRGDLSAYDEGGMIIHRHCISVVNDPVKTNNRKVMLFDVKNKDIGPTENPRAQVQTPMSYDYGDTVFVRSDIMFPDKFPGRIPIDKFITLSEIYGAPYKGSAPWIWQILENQLTLRYTGEKVWRDSFKVKIPFVKNIWYSIVYKTVLGTEGEIQAWVNGVEVYKQTGLPTILPSNAEGKQYHKDALYFSLGLPDMQVYFAEHRVGSSFEEVSK